MAIQHINQIELSRRWRLSPRTLERWRYRGTGPQYLKVGGRVVYRVDDIDAFEATHLHASRDATLRPTTPLRIRPSSSPPRRPSRRSDIRRTPGTNSSSTG